MREVENIPTLRPFQDPGEEPAVPMLSARHCGEEGTEEWIQIHSALDGFPIYDADELNAQVPPPVLGSKTPVHPLQSLTVDRGAPQSGESTAHEKGIFS